MADNDTLRVGDSEEFMGTLDAAIAKVQKLGRVTGNANKKLNTYADTFDKLNEKMAEYVEISEGIQPVKAGVKGGKSGSGSSGKSGSKGKNDLGNGKFKQVDAVFKAATNMAKAAKTGNVSAAATSAAKLSTLLGSKMVLASGALGASLVALTKITMDASKQTAAYSKSLQQMGVKLSDLEKSSLTTANNMTKVGNQVGNAFQSLGEALSPVLNVIVAGTAGLLELMGADGGEAKSKMYGSQANISNAARQSGFSLSSANALAGGTYRAALGIAGKYGMNGKESEVAQALGSAWLNGSDAAKDYGVVLNDNVLTGYMASKGIDIANTQITDAMKQYYRYQLMLEQTSATNQDDMQNMIKKWTQLGITIDSTKGKLFSFDEVIQLDATDNRIPDVLGGLYGADTSDDIKQNVITPIHTSTEAVKDLNAAVEALPKSVAVPVSVPISMPGYSYLPMAEEYINSLSGEFQTQVNIKVEGLELLDKAYTNLYRVQSLAAAASASSSVYNKLVTSRGTSGVNKSITPVMTSSSASNPANVTSSKTKITSKAAQASTAAVSSTGSVAYNSKLVATYGSEAVKTAQKIASKNGDNWNSLAYAAQQQYAIIAKEVNSNNVLSIADGVAMYNSYKKTGKVDTWWQSKQADAVGAGLAGAAIGLGLIGGALLSGGGTVAAGGAATGGNVIDATALFQAASAAIPAAATGGVGTKESLVRAFEGDKAEAIIPLETPEGVNYLASAMKQAGMGAGGAGSNITVNVNMRGLDIRNRAEVEKFANQVAEVIEVQVQRRGELSYGSKF